jgi:hypothetical protein
MERSFMISVKKSPSLSFFFFLFPLLTFTIKMSSIEDHELPKANVTRVLKQSVLQKEKQVLENVDLLHCLFDRSCHMVPPYRKTRNLPSVKQPRFLSVISLHCKLSQRMHA